MTRSYYINGAPMVYVKGNPDTFPPELANNQNGVFQLGLASESIKVTPRFSHFDVLADDYGPEVPAEILWNLAYCYIQMTLVHFDYQVLDACIAAAMGGGTYPILMGAGKPLGAGLPLYQSGNNYITLFLVSGIGARPWRFPACYLTGRPLEYPLGTEKSLVALQWRAIPYSPLSEEPGTEGEALSNGSILWDHTLDTGGDNVDDGGSEFDEADFV